MIKRTLALLCFLTGWCQSTVDAQTDSLNLKKQRIGLVLSGGGAKGLAHIGVLKALEQKGIYPSIVSGTSMGALVGGMYAAGYTASQIDTIFNSIDFSLIFNDKPERVSQNILEKINWKPIRIPFKLDSTFSLQVQQGLSAGQNLTKYLSMYTHHTTTDFKALPIPFFAMATDLVSMREIKLDTGHLAYAMRSSSALPSAFTPFVTKGFILSDGGILNNLPVKETRETGLADVLITHNVMRQFDSSSTANIGDMVYKLTTIKMRENFEQQLPYGDINLQTNTNHIPVVDFSNIPDKIDIGYTTVADSLAYLPDTSPTERTPTIAIPKLSDSLYIRKITTNGKASPKMILNKLFFTEQQATTFRDLHHSIDYLYSEQRYSNVSYEYNPIDSSLNLTVLKKPNANRIILGGFYDNNYGINLNAGIDVRDLLIDNSRITADINIGSLQEFDSQFYIDNGIDIGLGLDFNVQQFGINVWSNAQARLDNYNTAIFNLNFYFMNRYKNFALLRYGINSKLNHFGYDFLNRKILVPKVETKRLFNFSHNVFMEVVFDGLDNIHYPTSGTRFKANVKTYFYLEPTGNFFSNPSNFVKRDEGFRERPDNIQLTVDYDQVVGSDYLGLYLRYRNHTALIKSDAHGVAQLSVIGGQDVSGVNSQFAIPFDGLNLTNISSIHNSYFINKLDTYFQWHETNSIGLGFHHGFFEPIRTQQDEDDSTLSIDDNIIDYYSVSIHYGGEILGIPIGLKWAKNLQGSFNSSPVFYFHVGYNL